MYTPNPRLAELRALYESAGGLVIWAQIEETLLSAEVRSDDDSWRQKPDFEMLWKCVRRAKTDKPARHAIANLLAAILGFAEMNRLDSAASSLEAARLYGYGRAKSIRAAFRMAGMR